MRISSLSKSRKTPDILSLAESSSRVETQTIILTGVSSPRTPQINSILKEDFISLNEDFSDDLVKKNPLWLAVAVHFADVIFEMIDFEC